MARIIMLTSLGCASLTSMVLAFWSLTRPLDTTDAGVAMVIFSLALLALTGAVGVYCNGLEEQQAKLELCYQRGMLRSGVSADLNTYALKLKGAANPSNDVLPLMHAQLEIMKEFEQLRAAQKQPSLKSVKGGVS
jgi:hypothetical protein